MRKICKRIVCLQGRYVHLSWWNGNWQKGCSEETCLQSERKAAMAHRLLVRGQRLSSTAIVSVAGVLDCFWKCWWRSLYMILCLSGYWLHLMPFNGTNPHSIVVYSPVYTMRWTRVESGLTGFRILCKCEGDPNPIRIGQSTSIGGLNPD